MAGHTEFLESLEDAKNELEDLVQLDKDINEEGRQANPYTWFTIEAIHETWINLLKRVSEFALLVDFSINFKFNFIRFFRGSDFLFWNFRWLV